jgi:hypothetical protein
LNTFAGSVSIGNTGIHEKLRVEGEIKAHADVGDVRISIDSATNSDAQLKFLNGGGNSHVIFSDGSATNDPLIFYDYASSTQMMTLNNGKVGIGTTSPARALHVVGDALITGILTAQEFHTEFVSASVVFESGSTKFGDTQDDIHNFTGSFRQSGSLGNHYFQTGNVGIGTSSPGVALEVIGSVSGSSISTGSFGRTEVSSGKVLGVSTSGVSTPFSIVGGTSTSAGGLQFGAYNGDFGGIWNGGVTPATNNYALVANATRTVLNAPTDIAFFISDSTNNFYMNSTGVGIGNTSPAHKLDVTGTGRFTGDLTLGGNLVGDNATNISAVNDITALGDISGSSTSTGSFGRTSTDTLDLNSIQGNWTNAGNTVADLGTVTTVDINGGTIDGITALTADGDLDIGAHDLRAATITADSLTATRVPFAGTDGVLSDDTDLTFATATLSATNLTTTGTIKNMTLVSGSSTSTGSFGTGHFTGTNNQIKVFSGGTQYGNWNQNSISSLNAGLNLTGATTLRLKTNAGTTAVHIAADQNVGIGELTPDHRLDIHGTGTGTSGAIIKISGDDGSHHWAGIKFADSNTQKWALISDVNADDSHNIAFYNYVGGAVSLIIDGGTNKLGIGEPTPDHRLDIHGTGTGNASAIIKLSGDDGSQHFAGIKWADSNTDKWGLISDVFADNSHNIAFYNYADNAVSLKIDGGTNIVEVLNISGSSTSTGSFGRVNAITGFFEAGSKISDYVFEDDYNLRTLNEVEVHISQSKHLPGIPSEANIQEWRDLSMGDRDRLLLEKIEELTLYTLQLNKRIEELEGNS